MNKEQLYTAQTAMINWLSDTHELGKSLSKLNVQVNLILMICITTFSSLK